MKEWFFFINKILGNISALGNETLWQTQSHDWIVDKEEIENKEEEEPDRCSVTEYFMGKIKMLYAQSCCFFKGRIDKYGL